MRRSPECREHICPTGQRSRNTFLNPPALPSIRFPASRPKHLVSLASTSAAVDVVTSASDLVLAHADHLHSHGHNLADYMRTLHSVLGENRGLGARQIEKGPPSLPGTGVTVENAASSAALAGGRQRREKPYHRPIASRKRLQRVPSSSPRAPAGPAIRLPWIASHHLPCLCFHARRL